VIVVPETDVAHAYALLVLTVEGDQIAAITWFADSSLFPQFRLPRMLR
jgi:RNA polymerase sigma-70 factor, ECF subfamily